MAARSNMNKVERVRAALNGAEVDRVPASFWLHFPKGKRHGVAALQSHMDYYRATSVDFLKVMNEHPYEGNVDLNVPSDWRALRPAPISSLFFQQQLDEVKLIVDAIGNDCLVITTIFGPFSGGNHASNNKVTEHLKADPSSVSAGLATIAESLTEFAQACIDAGAAGIYYSAQGGEDDRFTEQEFTQYIKPHDLTVLHALDGLGEFNLLHICGDRIRLPLYADYPSHAVNWAANKANLNLKQGYSLFKRTIVGGLHDRGVIVNGSRDEIQATVHQVISDFGTRSFMLGADCTVPTEINLDNVRAAVEATNN
jgi:uroporphyrinogen decarboxylase